jgi:hypothetical protein
MEGLFHKKLSLIRNDTDHIVGVVISGPITWGENEASARIGAVVTQNSVTASGITQNDVHFPAENWLFAVPVEEDALHEGYAKGEATAEVRAPNGSTKKVSWTTPEITLR